MSMVCAAITTSVDGYITGPEDGPGCGLGIGGERLHYWVFGGAWSCESGTGGEPTGEDKVWLDQRSPRRVRSSVDGEPTKLRDIGATPTRGGFPSLSSPTGPRSSHQVTTSFSSAR